MPKVVWSPLDQEGPHGGPAPRLLSRPSGDPPRRHGEGYGRPSTRKRPALRSRIRGCSSRPAPPRHHERSSRGRRWKFAEADAAAWEERRAPNRAEKLAAAGGGRRGWASQHLRWCFSEGAARAAPGAVRARARGSTAVRSWRMTRGAAVRCRRSVGLAPRAVNHLVFFNASQPAAGARRRTQENAGERRSALGGVAAARRLRRAVC